MQERYSKFDARLGKRLRGLRQCHGWSLADLATEIGVSYQQVQKYESGGNRIPVARLMHIAELFDISPLALLDHDPAHKTRSTIADMQGDEEHSRLHSAYFSLQEPTRRAILQLIEAIAASDTQR